MQLVKVSPTLAIELQAMEILRTDEVIGEMICEAKHYDMILQ